MKSLTTIFSKSLGYSLVCQWGRDATSQPEAQLNDVEHVANAILVSLVKQQCYVNFTIQTPNLTDFAMRNGKRTKFEADGMASEQKVRSAKVITRAHPSLAPPASAC